jgi:ABC-type antimicrobial peptide transport system permease subunit
MIEIIGYLIGILGAIWVVSYILTFLWRSFKQKVDKDEIVLATILAGLIRFL